MLYSFPANRTGTNVYPLKTKLFSFVTPPPPKKSHLVHFKTDCQWPWQHSKRVGESTDTVPGTEIGAAVEKDEGLGAE